MAAAEWREYTHTPSYLRQAELVFLLIDPTSYNLHYLIRLATSVLHGPTLARLQPKDKQIINDTSGSRTKTVISVKSKKLSA